VAIGKGAGVLAVPLTEDTEAVLTFLEGLSSSAITGRGTNLESLVDAALGAFQDAFPARRWIILFSDGEALSGSLAQAVDRALKARVMITTVALGSETGGPVPEDPEKGSEDTVMSYLNPGPLQSAAERTGGLYLEAGEKDTAARLAEQFRGVSPDSVSAAFRREAKSQSHLFIFAALGAWGIAVLAGKRRKGYGEKNV
jgi:Ca-activated chloride channel family protein